MRICPHLCALAFACASLLSAASTDVNHTEADGTTALDRAVRDDDLKAAQAAGNAGTEAKTLNAMGDVYSGVSEFQKAVDTYSQALTLARSAKDAPQEAAALNGIAGCYRDQGQNDKALGLFQQALDLATGSGDLRG